MEIQKPTSEWSDEEKKKSTLDARAMNSLNCALSKQEYFRVSDCQSAHRIWKRLEVMYEGTSQVKESKISRLTREYELFQMEENESIHNMNTRFTNIINFLAALGKTFTMSERVKKVLRSLPKEWRPKKTAIEESKNLNTLSLDNLIGSLINYEEELESERKEEEKSKRQMAFKSQVQASDEIESDEEEAMMARKFKKMWKNPSQRKMYNDFRKERSKQVITCYECNKPGHIK